MGLDVQERLQALTAMRGRDPAAREVGAALLAELDDAGVPPTDPIRADVVEQLMFAHQIAGDLRGAHALGRAAVDACPTRDDVPAKLALALADAARLAESADGLDLSLWSVGRADAEGDRRLRQDARANLAEVLVREGDLAAAARWCAEAEAIAPPWERRGRVWVARAHVATGQGRVDEACAAWSELAAQGRRTHTPSDVGTALQYMATLVARTEPLRALSLLDESEEALASVNADLGLLITRNARGEILRTLARFDEARAAFDAALALHPTDVQRLIVGLNRALVDLDAGDLRAAAQALASLPSLPGMQLIDQLVVLGQLPLQIREGAPALAIDAVLGTHGEAALTTGGDPDVLLITELAADEAEARGEPTTLAWAARLMTIHHDVALRMGNRVAAQAARSRLDGLKARGAPTVLGPFDLGAPIGIGNSGAVVFAGRHVASGAEVAVKVLTEERGPGRSLLANELQSLARLDHPHIVWLLQHGEVGASSEAMGLRAGAPWIAMERAVDHAGSLCGEVPWPRVRDVLLAVLDALAHAHARGLLHLDIKPANVLLFEDGSARLADFGIAAVLSQGRDRVAGTPEFMAPEQLEPDAVLDARTDLFAVGCLAASLLQGFPPFLGGNVAALQAAHALDKPPILKPAVAVPDGFSRWVRTLLARRPDDRFAHPADAARALHDLGTPLPGREGSTLPLEIGAWPRMSGKPAPAAARVPTRWTRDTVRHAAALHDAGLGLYPVRRHALVGRHRERDLLWSLLRSAAVEGRSRLAVLVGPPGAGARALADWLEERALEVGAVTPVVGPRRGLAILRVHAATDPGGPDDWLSGPEPRLVVVTAHDTPELDRRLTELLDHPAAFPVEVAPLQADDAVAVLRSRLAITPDLARALIGLSATLADAVARLDRHVAAGELVLGPDGYRLRAGAAVELAAEVASASS